MKEWGSIPLSLKRLLRLYLRFTATSHKSISLSESKNKFLILGELTRLFLNEQF